MLNSKMNYVSTKYDAVLLQVALNKQDDFKIYDIEKELEPARNRYEFWQQILDGRIKTRE
jgi:hypothetical protein